MFLKILLNYIIGYVRISIEGYYIERFINICTNNNILIWNLKRKNNIKMHLNCSISNFKNIVKIAKQTKCKVKIERKKGIPFILNRYRKRKIFLILLMLVCIAIFISSNYVWNIELKVEEDKEVAGIKEDLNEAGLVIGMRKSNIDTKEIVNKIRLKREDIAWIGIEQEGTNVIVKLVKADEKPEIINQEEYCNIVSEKEGIITKINAQNGTAMVKVGDTVQKGTTLIAGWMEGKYTGIRYVHSIGEIEAKVWYTKTKKVYYSEQQEELTGNEEKKYSIKFNNFKINFHKGVSKFKIYDTIDEEKKFKIFSNFYLPISVVKTTNLEKNVIQKQHTIEEAKDLGIKDLEQQLEKEISDKESILGKNVNTYERDGYIEVNVTYEVLENIGTNEKIVF